MGPEILHSARHRVLVRADQTEGLSEALDVTSILPVIFSSIFHPNEWGWVQFQSFQPGLGEKRERSRPRVRGERRVPRNLQGKTWAQTKLPAKRNSLWDAVLHGNSPRVRGLEAQVAGAQ